MDPEASALWAKIRNEYARMLYSIPRASMYDFFTPRIPNVHGSSVDRHAKDVIDKIHNNAGGMDTSELCSWVLTALLAFHDPIVDSYVMAPNTTTTDGKMLIGRLRSQTGEILRAHYLL
jgi:hypothetical protein